MNLINSINSTVPATPVSPAGSTPAAAPASGATPSRGADTVEISGTAQLMATLKANPIRTDKVADIKSQIAAGSYEDDNKLTITADRVLDDLNS